MSYEDRDQYGMYVDNGHKGPGPELMGADTLIGDHVHNLKTSIWARSRKSCSTCAPARSPMR
jgi:hypothetical protein